MGWNPLPVLQTPRRPYDYRRPPRTSYVVRPTSDKQRGKSCDVKGPLPTTPGPSLLLRTWSQKPTCSRSDVTLCVRTTLTRDGEGSTHWSLFSEVERPGVHAHLSMLLRLDSQPLLPRVTHDRVLCRERQYFGNGRTCIVRPGLLVEVPPISGF